MNCSQAKELLLRADDPRPESCASPELAEHLSDCVACRSVAQEIAHLEEAWRSQLLPAEADRARLAFLARPPRVARPAAPRPQRPQLPRWLAAAVLLCSIGIAGWFLFSASEAHAAPALIEQLVDWNVELAQAPPAERQRLYDAQQPALADAVRQASLVDRDRELAGLLLENGTWLTQNDDPVATAERFSAVADKLVDHLQTASDRKDTRLANRYAKLQAKVLQRGISDNLQKAEESGTLNFDKNKKKLEKLVLRDKDRMNKLLDLLDKNPDISRKELREALDIPPKHPKGKAKK
jgi:hypothetical protein